MEPQPPIPPQPSPVFGLEVDQSAARNLTGAAGWAKFIAIVVFIGLGLMVIAFVTVQQQMSDMFSQMIPGIDSKQGFTIIVVAVAITAIICIILMVLLMRGAVLIKRGINTKNQETFNSGLGSLKGFFIMYGILAIIGILFNIIGLFAK